jgi:hypothetical protein
MPSHEQLNAVGNMCKYYDRNFSLLDAGEELEVSCTTCGHWENDRCNINVFDRILTGLDQT